jgi:hypothetical protein
MVVLLGFALFGEVSVRLGRRSATGQIIGTEAYLDPMLEAIQLQTRVRINNSRDRRGIERAYYLPARVGNLAASLADWRRPKISKICSIDFSPSRRSRRAYLRGGGIPLRQITSRMVMD